MTTLQKVFYVGRSLATRLQVEELLQVSRRPNARDGLSGALLFTGGYFAQLLKGPVNQLHAAMLRIGADPRHTAVKRLQDVALTQRRFGRWTMASGDVVGAVDLLAHLLSIAQVKTRRVERLIDLVFEGATPTA